MRYSLTLVRDFEGHLVDFSTGKMSLPELAPLVGSLRRKGELYAYLPGEPMREGYYVRQHGFLSGMLGSEQVSDLITSELERQRVKEKFGE